MPKTKLVKSAGRFGVRYGQSVKRRLANIEGRQRKRQACPFCSGRAVRLSKGIWKCKKCEKKFAGHAYYLESAYDYALSGENKEKQPAKDKAQSLKKEEAKPKKARAKKKTE